MSNQLALSFDLVTVHAEAMRVAQGIRDDAEREHFLGVAKAAHAASTRRQYNYILKLYYRWCAARERCPLPVSLDTMWEFLSWYSIDRDCNTVVAAAAAIRWLHKHYGMAAPYSLALQDFLKSLRRQSPPDKGKEPLRPEQLIAMSRVIDRDRNEIRGLRDRAMLLLGFNAGRRRSEVTALDIEDLDFQRRGVVICVRRSKTDQEGEGHYVAIPYHRNGDLCAVRALLAWLKARGARSGALFVAVRKNGSFGERLHPSALNRLVQTLAALIGETDPKRYGAHSLRSGYATSSYEDGVPESRIMDVTLHRSLQGLRPYLKRRSLWHTDVSLQLGL